MSEIISKKIASDLKSMNLEVWLSVMMVCEMLTLNDDAQKAEIQYSKKYFTSYYCITGETLNKWVRIFCPNLWKDDYRTKRNLTDEEANYIFESLGRVTFHNMPPQTRKELMKEIYSEVKWKKSKKYNELQGEISDLFEMKQIRLHKIPPKYIRLILAEEIENYQSDISSDEGLSHQVKVFKFTSICAKYSNLSEHQIEVRRRYLRRWLTIGEELS